MIVRRLRPSYTEQQMAELYAAPYDPTRWEDHIERIRATLLFGQRFVRSLGVPEHGSVADLSCGSGAVASGLGLRDVTLGDFAPGHPICGRLEQTLPKLGMVDIYVCTETLEHLSDPIDALEEMRVHVRRGLLLSTPVGTLTGEPDENPEHYWAWDRLGVDALLDEAGWTVGVYEEIRPWPGMYVFGLWGCV